MEELLITIRKASAYDTARLLGLATRFAVESVYREFLHELDRSYVTELIARVLRDGVIFVAEDDELLAGMLAMLPVAHPLTGTRYGEELVWYVEPSQRRGTVGPRLLQAGTAWALEQQLPWLQMSAPYSTTVCDYLQRQGFKPYDATFIKGLV